jgi:DNA-binding response OmpR family regulator
MADQTKHLIAVVNHDPVYLGLVQQILAVEGYEPLICPEGTAAHSVIVERQPDAVLLDTWLEHQESGWILLQTLRLDEQTMHIPILLCTSDPDGVKARIEQIEKLGQIRVLNKPFDPATMLREMKEMLASEKAPITHMPSSDGSRPENVAKRELQR